MGQDSCYGAINENKENRINFEIANSIIAHVAFEVEDLNSAIKGKEVIIEPNSPSEGVMVAFILEDDAPVELIEFKK